MLGGYAFDSAFLKLFEVFFVWFLEQRFDLKDSELQHLQVSVQHADEVGLRALVERGAVDAVLLHYFVNHLERVGR